MKKRLLSLLLVAVMFISFLPMAEVSAAELPAGATGWLVNEGDNQVWYTLTKTSEEDGDVLTIGGTGEMPDYSDSENNKSPWYNNTQLISVIFDNESQITRIGANAFKGCTGLEDIQISDTVTSIGEFAFEGCTSLEFVVFYNCVTSIGANAFKGCVGLEGVQFLDTVESIGESAFKDCVGLEEVQFLDTVTSIGESAFEGCTRVGSIAFMGNVESIGKSAFEDCTNLGTVIFYDSVTSIGACAFKGCVGLEEVQFLDTVKIIGESAFEDCTGLVLIEIPAGAIIGANAFKGCIGLEMNNWLVNDNDNQVWYALKSSSEGGEDTLTIGGTGAMPDYSDSENKKTPWYNNTKLISVYFDDESQITRIGANAFKGCTGLEEIDLPDSVTNIGDSAFEGCTGLKNIWFPDTVTNIGACAFKGCTGLEAIGLPDSVTNIGDSAFELCTGLKNIWLLDSVTSIGNDAFLGCNINRTYMAEDNIITVRLGNGECDLPGIFAKLTLAVPADGFVYDGTYKEITFGTNEAENWKKTTGTDVLPSIVYYMEDGNTRTYAGTEKEGKAPVCAGNYVAKLTVENKTATVEFTVGKFTPAAPEGLVSVQPTEFGKPDGKITKTTNTMEYSMDADSEVWISCNANEITGLAAGTYYVRIKVTDSNNYNPGACAEVIIPDGNKRFNITVTGYEGVYDGNTHGIVLSGAELDGATVMYGNSEGNYDKEENIKFTDVTDGSVTVYFKVSKDKYHDFCGSETVKITRKNIADAEVGSFASMIYNGSKQEPSADVSIDGLTVTGSWSSVENVTDTTSFTADGNFEGTIVDKNPGMTKMNIAGAEAGSFEPMTYTGSGQTPAADVNIDGMSVSGSWSKVTNVADTTTFTADGNFEGKIENCATGMEKYTPAAPSGLQGVKPTEFGNQDGKIIGTNTDMEYSTNAESENWTACTENEITDLAAGTYYVRLKVTDTANTTPGIAAEVTVPDGNKRFDITATGYEGSYDGDAHGIILSGADLNGATVRYGTSKEACDKETLTFTDVTDGIVTVYFKVSKDGYFDYNGDGTVTIGKKSIAGATVGAFDKMIYNGSEQTPSATVTVDGLTVTGSWSGVTDVADTATFTADGNFEGTIADIATGMEKSTPESPEGLGSVKPTEFGATDGKITGTTDAMEYSMDAESEAWTSCKGNEIAGLAAGTYYVHLKETDNTNAGTSATVTISEGDKKNFDITVINYNAEYDGKAHGITLTGVPEGATVKYGTAEGTYDRDSITYTDFTDGAKKVFVQVTMYGYNDFTGDGSINITKSKPVVPIVTPDPIVISDPIVTPNPIVTPDPKQENEPTAAPEDEDRTGEATEGQTGETTEGQSGNTTEGQTGETTPAEGEKTTDEKPATKAELKQQLTEVFTENKVVVTEEKLDSAVSVTKKDSAYYDESGKKITSSFIKTADGKYRYVGTTGKSVKKAVVATFDAETGEKKMYYAGKNGVIVKDKVVTLPDGGKIFASEDGTLATNELVTSGKHQYFAGKDGRLLTNQIIRLEDGTRYYVNKYGYIRKNALITAPDGDRRYATADGTLAKSCWVTVGKKMYWCNKIGRITESKSVK